VSWKSVLAIIAIILVAAVAVMGYQALTATKTFNGQYMTFKYPESWEVRAHNPPGDIDEHEHVMIQEKEEPIGRILAVNAYANASLEDIEANVTGSGPLEETIGDVHCITYYDDSTRLKSYIFQKNGRTFLVVCSVTYTGVAEDIIKSIKPK